MFYVLYGVEVGRIVCFDLMCECVQGFELLVCGLVDYYYQCVCQDGQCYCYFLEEIVDGVFVGCQWLCYCGGNFVVDVVDCVVVLWFVFQYDFDDGVLCFVVWYVGCIGEGGDDVVGVIVQYVVEFVWQDVGQ